MSEGTVRDDVVILYSPGFWLFKQWINANSGQPILDRQRFRHKVRVEIHMHNCVKLNV